MIAVIAPVCRAFQEIADLLDQLCTRRRSCPARARQPLQAHLEDRLRLRIESR